MYLLHIFSISGIYDELEVTSCMNWFSLTFIAASCLRFLRRLQIFRIVQNMEEVRDQESKADLGRLFSLAKDVSILYHLLECQFIGSKW